METPDVEAMIETAMAKRILVCDDSKTFQQLERALLSGRGYDIIEASDGSEAVKKALEHVPDLILLDVQMPIMDGVQVLQFLRKDERTRHIPVIMITTIGRDLDKRLLTAGGASAVLHKPINGIALNRVVREMLA
jgi:CheY-like chemotaxis protein